MTQEAPIPSNALALEGDLDVFGIHLQWERFQPLLQRGPEPETVLDLSCVGDLDLSGVQLLAALDRDLRARGGRLVLTGLQPALRERFLPLGLAALFGEGAL